MRCLLLVCWMSLLGPISSPRALAAQTPTDTVVARITHHLLANIVVKGRPTRTHTLSEEMTRLHVPGVSIAVADSGRTVWERGFGLAEVGTTDSVTPTTLFQAASISKVVTATAMLRLVQEGRLALDTPVNRYLKSWKVPHNRFTEESPVTLRRIVSHSAGFTVHGFPGYPAGAPLPTVPQILDGVKPANSPPVRVDTVPGAIWRYSGGGIMVEQLVLTDVTGEPFPELMKRLVLDPLGMTHSTYEQPLPRRLQSHAAAGYWGNGTMVPGRWHTYPEMAAAGLWTTPTDLLKWAEGIAAARAGRAPRLLSKRMATEMLTVQKGPSGLGPMLAGSGRGFHFEHGGANAGYRCNVIYFPATGQGAAVMTNGAGGQVLTAEVLYAIGKEYGWSDYGPRVITPLHMDSAALSSYVGEYVSTKPAIALLVTEEHGRLFGQIVGQSAKEELVFTAPNRTIALPVEIALTFGAGPDGRITRVSARGLTFTRRR